VRKFGSFDVMSRSKINEVGFVSNHNNFQSYGDNIKASD